ncbi:winged helix-turn-helix transcriptional regulator [Larkinella sp. VNQ87]|uniref:winged helix-turn-helix transcriptional regulator n=1 Tax=Larkinella sp. VNQ87 TaxID=3400921 RepID=UPI003BFF706F
MTIQKKQTTLLDRAECNQHLAGVQDALYVLNGKWKLPIIIALAEGHTRFKELQRTVSGITPKLLTKELRELEINEFVIRKVYPTTPVRIEYELTPYSDTLQPIIKALSDWGKQHRARIQSR